MERLVNQVFYGDALRLMSVMPSHSVDEVLADAMFGTAKNLRYDWGLDPAKGDPKKHWQYHQTILEECRRVLKPGGILAWAQSFKFIPYFDDWFGPHRVWSPLCTAYGLNFIPNTWVVQTKEQHPLEHPNNMIVFVDRIRFIPLKERHPCPKPTEEMSFLIENLSKPGDIILDCFSGTGSTLVAAKELGRRYIGCDLSRNYCRVALRRLRETNVNHTRNGYNLST